MCIIILVNIMKETCGGQKYHQVILFFNDYGYKDHYLIVYLPARLTTIPLSDVIAVKRVSFSSYNYYAILCGFTVSHVLLYASYQQLTCSGSKFCLKSTFAGLHMMLLLMMIVGLKMYLTLSVETFLSHGKGLMREFSPFVHSFSFISLLL